jgi:hypothetical protein
MWGVTSHRLNSSLLIFFCKTAPKQLPSTPQIQGHVTACQSQIQQLQGVEQQLAGLQEAHRKLQLDLELSLVSQAAMLKCKTQS